MKKRKVICQGDVTFIPIEYFDQNFINSFSKKKEGNVIAEGEVTGHFHCLVDGDAEIYISQEIKQSVNQMLIKIREKARIEHQEHEAFEINGDYIVTIQQEVDHFEKILRKVSD